MIIMNKFMMAHFALQLDDVNVHTSKSFQVFIYSKT